MGKAVFVSGCPVPDRRQALVFLKKFLVLGALAVVMAAPLAAAVATPALAGGAAAASPVLVAAPGQKPQPFEATVAQLTASPLPQLLSAADAERYTNIFSLQTAGDWPQADRLMRQLEDRLLMGHVLFQRYMHPTKYRSSFDELSAWMSRYADHPSASQIYRLALKRRPKNAAYPKKPITKGTRGIGTAPKSAVYESPRRRNAAQLRSVRAYEREIKRHVKRGAPTRALTVLSSEPARALLDPVETDRLRARIATGYLRAHKIEKALSLAATAAKQSRAYAPDADWTAGLAAWRLDRYGQAAEHFAALGASKTAKEKQVAAGAFWAARAFVMARSPDQVVPALAAAARHPRNIYGQMAARLLGRHADFDWRTPPLDQGGLASLMARPEVRRAMALAAVGQQHRAETELRLAHGRGRAGDDGALLGLAARLDLPATQLRLSEKVVDENGRAYDSALYPLPDWRPKGGFTIDKALVYAVVHQESRFNAWAKSRSGARGLMQLMPRTASYIGRDRSLRWSNRFRLYDPDFNMKLGQRYLAYLAKSKNLPDDLAAIAGAYNGGPGNLSRWLKAMDHQDDVLLFIESLPSNETRGYVKKVLAYMWIYRRRLAQRTPSLTAMAMGSWPRYTALDAKPLSVAAK